MKTLYDLLGALPNDEAEGLRTAFRKAVKSVHPDLHPGDPDAALKFRQIARANEILSDSDQRAAYDHLLGLARLEQQLASKRATAARIHKLASSVMAVAGISVVSVGGYLLFMHISMASIAPANEAHVTMRAPTEVAAVSPGSVDTTNKSAPLPKYASASIPGETIVPKAAFPRTNAESVPAAYVGPPLDLAASNAKALRARAISAYRNGDLKGAIADLDHAVQLDPKFSAAYIDRGIIFYRLREFGRAFADIARGERIEKRAEKASRTKSPPPTAGKHRLDQAKITPPATRKSRQRTAAQDPSREGGEAAVTLR
jgi:curved DNA-binding protein CbpA